MMQNLTLATLDARCFGDIITSSAVDIECHHPPQEIKRSRYSCTYYSSRLGTYRVEMYYGSRILYFESKKRLHRARAPASPAGVA